MLDVERVRVKECPEATERFELELLIACPSLQKDGFKLVLNPRLSGWAMWMTAEATSMLLF